MSTKRKYEEEEIEEETTVNDYEENIEDSDDDDDDDDGKKYEILEGDDIEGQEDGVVRHDGEVQITPFNMEEELEEGHFDSSGMYHWNKEKEMRDNWLENIDWVKIKQKDEEQDDDSDTEDVIDEIAIYKEMLKFMAPKETVNKSLRRLGGNASLSASERLKRKKAGLAYKNEDAGNKEAVTKLTELANKILTKGNMDIYQETFEHINEIVKSKEKADSVDAFKFDMYADDFSAQETCKDEETKEIEKKTEDKVEWEYKMKIDSEVVEGPYTSQQMNEWMNTGHFKDQIWIRRCGTDGEFYSSRRIDFELYL